MAKKSRKRPVRLKKDNAGCMPSLISMFDFRQGRFTQRLLSNRPVTSRDGGNSRNKIDLHNLDEKQKHVYDIDAKGVVDVTSGKASIRALMEEEMSGAHNLKISSSRVEQLRAELGFTATLQKNRKTSDKTHKRGSDSYSTDSMASPSTWSVPSEISSSDANLADLMLEFCSENHQSEEKHIEIIGDKNNNSNNFLGDPDKRLTEKHHILKKALSDIREAHLSTDSENINNLSAIQPKEFIHALETLSSNKELFLKLLKDPDSVFFEKILGLQNTQRGGILDGYTPPELVNDQLPHKQGRHNFFRKKDKSERANSISENSFQDSKRIVVLKPSPTSQQYTISPILSPTSYKNLQHLESSERVSSHFSIKEIKRRLKNVIGQSRKHQHLIAMDGVLHKVPYGFKTEDEESKASTSTEQNKKLTKFLKRGKVSSKLKEQFQNEIATSTTAHRLHRESVFYEEARKRLVEMLSSGSQDVVSPRHVSKQLGKIISLPGYNSLSPLVSPARDKEIYSPRLSTLSSLQRTKQDDFTATSNPATQSIASLSCSDSKLDAELQLIDKNPTLLETQLEVNDHLITGNSGIEKGESSDVFVEFSTNEPDCTREKCNQEEFCFSSDSEPLREEQLQTPCVSHSHESSLVQKLQSSEIIAENPDHPSPVSVLEPLFSENSSPDITETNQAKLRIEPQQLSFEENSDSPLLLSSTFSEANQRACAEDKETQLTYVRTVLEASGLIYNPFPESYQSYDQLLDPFVYDEVEILYGQLVQDSELLFDCTNEVLIEMQQRYSSCNPWTSFIKPSVRPIPTGEKFVQEVCERVDWHLSTQFSCTLDQVVRKDLDVGTWMDARLETEGAVFEIGDVILEYLMEETILELWD